MSSGQIKVISASRSKAKGEGCHTPGSSWGPVPELLLPRRNRNEGRFPDARRAPFVCVWALSSVCLHCPSVLSTVSSCWNVDARPSTPSLSREHGNRGSAIAAAAPRSASGLNDTRLDGLPEDGGAFDGERVFESGCPVRCRHQRPDRRQYSRERRHRRQTEPRLRRRDPALMGPWSLVSSPDAASPGRRRGS
eukprot:4455136-Prymnesium_polylepis.2